MAKIALSAALTGAGMLASGVVGGADVDRVVHRPPQEVYRQFADIFQEEPIRHVASPSGGNEVGSEVETVRDTSIDYALMVDADAVMKIELRFDAVDEGQATRLRGDIDVDQAGLARLFDRAGAAGNPAAQLPEWGFKLALNKVLGAMIADVEAGRPLRPDMAFDGGGSFTEMRERMAEADGWSPAQRPDGHGGQRVHPDVSNAPMVSNRPMINPSEAAQQHLNGAR